MKVGALLIALVVISTVAVLGVATTPTQTTQILGFCTLSVLGLLQMIQAVGVAQKQEIADLRTEQVAGKVVTTEAKVDKLAEVASATHTLVNGKMGAQLQLTADLAERIANMPGATEKDKATAAEAQLKLREHKGRQFLVDNPNG